MSLLERVKPGISRRADFALQRNKCALLIIDVQKFLSYPNYEYFHETSLPRAIQNIEKLATQFRSVRDAPNTTQGCEVIVTYVQSSTKDGREVSLDYKLSGSLLANIPRVGDADIFLPEFVPDPHGGKGDILLPKTSCSVFQSTNLHYLLRNMGIEQIVVCGQLTDECIVSAVRDGADLGYFMTVPEDACAAIAPERHKIGLQSMHGFCRILKTSHIIWEIAESNDVSTSPTDSISLASITTFLKGRGFSDAAIEVAAQFSGNGSKNKQPTSPSTPHAQYNIVSHDQLTDASGSNGDVMTVTSAIADNIQRQQNQPPPKTKSSRSQQQQQQQSSVKSPTTTSPAKVDQEITPTMKNGIVDISVRRLASYNNTRGRDPSELVTPDLNHNHRNISTNTSSRGMTSTQYNNSINQQSPNSSNNKTNPLRHSTGKISSSKLSTSKERERSYSGPIDLDDDGVTIDNNNNNHKHDPPTASNELLEL